MNQHQSFSLLSIYRSAVSTDGRSLSISQNSHSSTNNSRYTTIDQPDNKTRFDLVFSAFSLLGARCTLPNTWMRLLTDESSNIGALEQQRAWKCPLCRCDLYKVMTHNQKDIQLAGGGFRVALSVVKHILKYHREIPVTYRAQLLHSEIQSSEKFERDVMLDLGMSFYQEMDKLSHGKIGDKITHDGTWQVIIWRDGVCISWWFPLVQLPIVPSPVVTRYVRGPVDLGLRSLLIRLQSILGMEEFVADVCRRLVS